MLRLANFYCTKFSTQNVNVGNLPQFDGAIKKIGTENFLGIDCSIADRILYEDDTFPRSTCPGCHGFIRPEDKFCIHCGASLQEMVCHHCRHTERPGAKFCSQCGAPLVVLKVQSIEP